MLNTDAYLSHLDIQRRRKLVEVPCPNRDSTGSLG